MSLRANLLAAIVTAIAALVLTLVLLEDPLVEYRQTVRVRDELLAAADTAALEIEAGGEPDEVADRVGAATASRITVVDEGGAVIGDTAFDGAALASRAADVADAAELSRAREEGTGTATRADRPDVDGAIMYAAVRGPRAIVVRAARPLATIEAARESTRELLLLGGILAGLAVILLTWVLSRTLVRPIEELTKTADAIARGDLTVRIQSDRRDELGRLGRALDRMADELAGRLGEIRIEEARLMTVLDSMVEAVFVTDQSGTIVQTNKALDQLVAAPPRGRTVVEAVQSTQLHEAVWAAMRGQTSSVTLEVTVRGKPLSLAAHVAPLPEDRGVVAVLHDVTDLRRADKIRRDFVANASHELRTPLTAIRGFAETLRGGAASDPDVANRFLDTILRHTTRLQRLVDDLLALSRSESPDQEFELGPTDVGPIVRDAVTYLEANASGKEIAVEMQGFDDLPPARANEWAFDHVMVNLIDNAVKYTPPGGAVTVRATSDDDHVAIEVCDTGPGIPDNKRARIFERFYRIDKGRSRDQGGTGLGLSIVKHLVQRMDATIDVDSGEDRGTTFRVQLERAAAPVATTDVALDSQHGEAPTADRSRS